MGNPMRPERLVRARLAAGLSINQVCAKMHIASSHWWSIEQGKYKLTMSLVRRFANACGTTPEEIGKLPASYPKEYEGIRLLINRDLNLYYDRIKSGEISFYKLVEAYHRDPNNIDLEELK